MGEMIGYWNFSEGSGTTVYDKSGYNSHGLMNSMDDTNWVQGVDLIDTCLYYSPGGTSRVDFGIASPLNAIGNGSFALCFWMKSHDATPNNNGLIVSKIVDANNQISVCSNGITNQLQVTLSKGGTIIITNFSAAPFDTKWHFITIVVNRDRDIVVCYLDGIEDNIIGDISSLPLDISNSGNVMLGATWSGGSPFEGFIDEVRIYKGILQYAEINYLFLNPNGKDEYYLTRDLIGFWPMDKGIEFIAYDRSGNNNHGALYTNMTSDDWVSGKNLYAIDFDGIDDHIDCGNNNVLSTLGIGDFSIAFWMKAALPISNYGSMVSKYVTATKGFVVQSNTTTNQLRVFVRETPSSAIGFNFNSTPFDEKWHFIVIVLDRTYNKVFAYIDGIKDGIEGDISSIGNDLSNDGVLCVGSATTTTLPFKGVVDEVRIYNRILSLGEIKFLFYYPNGIKPLVLDEDLQEGLIGLWRLDETTGLIANDISGYNNHGALEGMSGTEWSYGVSGNALNFDGVNDRVNFGNQFPLNSIGNGSFSISFWMKSKDTSPLNYGVIIAKWLDEDNRLNILSYGTTQKIRFGLYKNSFGATQTFDTTVFDGLWHHIIFLVDRDTDKVHCYVDGIKDNNEVDLSVLPIDSSNDASLTIGSDTGLSFPYEGFIDEVRIYNRILTYDEILFLNNYPSGVKIKPNFKSANGIELHIKSPSGELLGVLSDNNKTGEILDAEINVSKEGVGAFSFKISKNTTIPITLNTECYFYLNSVLISSGFVKEEPKGDQDAPILLVEGEGFFKRLKRENVNKSYTSQTLNFIVCDILNYYLFIGNNVGVNFNPYKINVPSLSNISIEFKDKKLDKVLARILAICNYDYNNTKYRLYVDNEKDVVIEPLSSEPVSTLIEGVDFQKPEVNIDNSKIINKIRVYRTVSGSPNSVEYIGVYNDNESQGKYGIFMSKLTFPDFVDTSTIEKIVDFIFDDRAAPQTSIKLTNLTFEEIFSFGEYRIFNRRELYWRSISDCDSFDGWDLSNLSSASASLSSSHVLTGKRSIAIETTTSSSSEYIEYTLEKYFPLPQIVRLFLYFEETAPALKITFYDEKSNSLEINVGSENLFSNQWIKYSKDIAQTTEVSNLEVNLTSIDVEDLEVDIDVSTTETLQVRRELNPGLLSVKKVRVEILSSTVGSFYIDRIDVYADMYSFHNVQLEEVKYNLSSIGLFAEINLGRRQDNIINEIQGKINENNLALQIFSKG